MKINEAILHLNNRIKMKTSNQLPLVTYEQAVRLKKMGFGWKTLCYYVQDNDKYDFFDFVTIKKSDKDCIFPFEVFEKNHNRNDEDYFSAPTVALAIKWMLEKGIFGVVDFGTESRWKGYYYKYVVFSDKKLCATSEMIFGSPLEAESVLLDAMLDVLDKMEGAQ
jgi:hypothetical protein